MKKLIISLCILSGVFNLAHAAGDPEAGIPLTAVCAGCHSADGNSAVGTFPKLAGQGEAYLLKQLQDIKSGNRVVVEMTGLLTNLNDQQLADVAAYFSSQSIKVGQADPDLVDLGESLYRAGNADTGVPACLGCHAVDGAGNSLAKFPALGGQHAQYVTNQLNKFQKGYRADAPSADARTNDGDAKIMRNIAFRLKDFEIEALSSYIQGLH
ncbi:MAG: c-type cytochrome [Reinekea sp.]